MVPSGETELVYPSFGGHQTEGDKQIHRVPVESFLMDRHAVSNADFAGFVAADGYSKMEYWPDELGHHVLQFVDQTRHAGPKYWTKGAPPRDQMNHPVVGISFYEAAAYACWAGKRLPTSAEWQHAGTWSASADATMRYPWGNSFDPTFANTWQAGIGQPVPVDQYYEGSTPNGIFQLIGNVWEWVDERFEIEETRFDDFGEIRGSAFNTYLECQTTCQFRTGKHLMSRDLNTGFRCCLSINPQA